MDVRSYRARLFSIPGVVGVGVGEYKGSECLRVYTERKASLPGSIGGVRVVPYQAGAFRKFSVTSYPPTYYQQAFRPYPAGVSIGSRSPSGVLEGTLGLIVPDADGSPLLLSNNHVMANDTLQEEGAEPGQLVQQPGGGEDVAELLRWVPLDLENPNRVDCAVARPLDPDQADPVVLGVGQPDALANPFRGMNVAKAGMATGFTMGVVLDVDASVRMQYGPFTATLEDQVIIGNAGFGFARPGDSGAAVLARARGKLFAVGLLVGGSDQFVVANRMSLVQDALGFRYPHQTLSRNPVSSVMAIAGGVLAPAIIK